MAGNSVHPASEPADADLVTGVRRGRRAAGLPPGVLSVVVEEGAAGAELLTTHPAVDMVSFTGSTAVGPADPGPGGAHGEARGAGARRQVGADLPARRRRPAPQSVRMVVVAMTAGPGVRRRPPACWSPQDRKDEVLDAVSAMYAGSRSARPTSPTPPWARSSARPARAVRALRRRSPRSTAARSSSAAAGRPGLDKGYYFEPTVLDVPDNANPAAQDEIFGPVHRRDRLRRPRRRRRDRQRQPLRAVRSGVRRRRRRGHRRRTAAAHRRGQRQHRRLQRLRAERRLQAERPRPRAGPDGIREFQEVKHMVIGELNEQT